MKYGIGSEPESTVAPLARPIARVIILPRKTAKRQSVVVPVPQTDTRGRVEYTEALGDSWLRN